ncbi:MULTISPECIES: hypothetical protein [unclassified Chamaesiphon]|uniref:hypothetical protein n=1 Tax=unclassified Chamaesiphon TaxID=2620921 RepID=UPI00286D074C|nr:MULTISPECIES: hypothetical protein [unclassified Chamaesiphon]
MSNTVYRGCFPRSAGNYRTYHVGAYLGDGLHEGAIISAIRVAKLIADTTPSQRAGESFSSLIEL